MNDGPAGHRVRHLGRAQVCLIFGRREFKTMLLLSRIHEAEANVSRCPHKRLLFQNDCQQHQEAGNQTARLLSSGNESQSES
jgi:hypothetical protein